MKDIIKFSTIPKPVINNIVNEDISSHAQIVTEHRGAHAQIVNEHV